MSFFGASGSPLVAQATRSFSFSEGQVAQKALDKIVAQLSEANLDGFAKDLEQQRLAASVAVEKRTREVANAAAQELLRQLQAEDEAWDASKSQECAAAKSSDACDGVRSYLGSFPSGRHSDDARAVLDQAVPILTVLAAEKAWRALDLGPCKRVISVDSCTPVEDYLKDYADSTHAAEATALLKQVGPRLKAAQKRAEARIDAAEDISSLCAVLDRLDRLKRAESLRVRVDRSSGTTNLSMKRRIAEGLIVSGDRKRDLQKAITSAGVVFRRAECPEPESDDSEE